MPRYNAPLKNIDRAETKRYAGLRKQADFPEQLVEQACNEALILARPQACWQIYQFDFSSGAIAAPEPVFLTAKSILQHLAGSVEIAVMAVTVGPELEAAIEKHFSLGEYSLGLLLDAAASSAVETIADNVNTIIADQALRRGFQTTFRFSPGYGDWDITAQQQILKLAEADTVNISLTPSCMLTPRKSITAVIGLTPAATAKKGLCNNEDCSACNMTDCYARKEINK